MFAGVLQSGHRPDTRVAPEQPRRGQEQLGARGPCTDWYAATLDNSPPPQLNCITLQKWSKHEDTMIATYESTCLPFLQSEIQKYTESDDLQLANSAQQLLAEQPK
jgi:hypothetical protein